MKLLSSYIKELKIASRGFYFYVEIGMAIVMLLILLFAVQENPESTSKEFVFYDMPDSYVEAYFADTIADGTVKIVEPATFTVKASDIEVTNKETGKLESLHFAEGTVEVKTYLIYDPDTGRLDRTMYRTKTKEDMIRLSYAEKEIGAIIGLDKAGQSRYVYYTQGYETDRFNNLLYVLHNESPEIVKEVSDRQIIRSMNVSEPLNTRQNLIPVFLVMTGSLMGFFVVMSYVFLDKSEGVIRAFAVTPSPVWKYLLSKTMVLVTSAMLSASIITLPVMGSQPNYLLFYLFIITTSFAVSALGLFVASFFSDVSKAFGMLFAVMILLMVPAFSYFIPGFDPLWIRFFPSYPMMQGFKEIILMNGNAGYVLLYSLVFIIGGAIFFALANFRFKKSLTV